MKTLILDEPGQEASEATGSGHISADKDHDGERGESAEEKAKD
jgi:hypothetical protein